jgi:hypothetical protein
MNTVVIPAWAGRNLRLDPTRLPQRVSYASYEDNGDVTFTINNRGVVVRRQLKQCGLPFSMVLPARAFQGVAARALENEDGDVTVTLELLHADPALSVPLLVADNLDDIAADWRSWSESYGLPMLLVEADGVARPLEDTLGAVKTRPSTARRRSRSSNKNRPRFLARRKVGGLGCRVVINGNEIIARR